MKLRLTSTLLCLLLTVACALAASWRELTQAEQAEKGATHEIRLTHADVDAATTNASEIYTNTGIGLENKVGLEFVYFYLEDEFANTNAIHFTNLTVKVGDTDDDDWMLLAKRVDTNAPAWVGYAESSQKVYAATNTILITWTPAELSNSFSEMQQGAARFYFKRLDHR